MEEIRNGRRKKGRKKKKREMKWKEKERWKEIRNKERGVLSQKKILFLLIATVN
jgi:hypothetical protein